MASVTRPGSDTTTKPLVIVGGGFAGTTTLLHWLLRAADDPSITPDRPLSIRLIERNAGQLYAGIPYGLTPHFSYNLNLTAKRVTPFAEGKIPPGFPSFEDYIADLSISNPRMERNFNDPARQLYGNYLGRLIEIALKKAGNKVDYQPVFSQVTDFHETKDGVEITMQDGTEMQASHMILATGLKDAVKPKFAFNAAASPDYLDYPYSAAGNKFYDDLIRGPKNTEKSSALVIGTGLTGMDAAIRLLDSGYKGKITMVSRRGLMHPVYHEDNDNLRDRLRGEPRDQSELPFTKELPDFMKDLDREPSFDSLDAKIKTELFRRLNEGYTTEEILGYWEKFVSDVYTKFPQETIDFLSKYETAINVARVGTTPELAEKILSAQRRGQLEIVTARVDDMTPLPDGGFSVALRPNDRNGQGTGLPETRAYTTVINGIGNSTKYDLKPEEIGDPLWRNLRTRNAYEVHPLRDGVNVTHDFSLIDGDGTPYSRVNVVGVPVSGHMNVTSYPYPEKEGSGARLGAFTLNIQGILGGVLAMIGQNYDRVNAEQKPILQSQPVPVPGPF